MYRVYTLLLATFCSTTIIFTQNTLRAIAILDLIERNGETNEADLISVKHLIDVVGVPHIVTTDLDLASHYSMIFCTSALRNRTFSDKEEDILEKYVETGGILFAPRIENDDLFALFGIDEYEESKSRHEIIWNSTSNIPALRYINEPEEFVISLGRSTIDKIFSTWGYLPAGAQTLASFADGTSAIIRNAHGLGQALAIGLSWKEVVLRNHINQDYEAQRITSNGFEPTMDVLMLFVRALYAEFHPYTVWKNTSPGISRAALMITHDVDSHTGMDSLHFFVDYEHANNIKVIRNRAG
jgi:hypothetical protein